jgi:tRNA (cytidine32/uridine32-2'-O)-methyltransferase
MAFDKIRIVMINTSHPGNIGAAARVMKNMGLTRLYLVQPKSFPDPQAEAMASGADDILQQAVVCDSFQQALEGCQLVLGSTARERKLQHDFIDARQAGIQTVSESGQNEIAVVFGRERTGMTNEELGYCHKLIHIPTNPDYRSLNVASAIQILCYEIMMAHEQQTFQYRELEQGDDSYASSEAMEGYYQHLEQTLADIGFLNRQQSPQLMPKLRHIYNRIRLKTEELNILRGILTKTQKILK